VRYLVFLVFVHCIDWQNQRVESASRRGKRELECASVSVRARSDLSPRTYEVSGCGKSVRYTCTNGYPTAWGRQWSSNDEWFVVCIPEPAPTIVEDSPTATLHLIDGDVIETNAQEQIVAVQHATNPPTWTRFKPGTASSPDDADYVRGEIVRGEIVRAESDQRP